MGTTQKRRIIDRWTTRFDVVQVPGKIIKYTGNIRWCNFLSVTGHHKTEGEVIEMAYGIVKVIVYECVEEIEGGDVI